MELTINLDDLTIGDLADIEDVTGVSMVGLRLDNPPMKIIPALLWVQERRNDPGYTYEMARAIKIGDLNLGGAAPTAAVAAGDGGGTASAPGS